MHGLTGGSWKRHTDRTRATEMKDTRGNLAVTSGSETYRRCALPRQLSTLLRHFAHDGPSGCVSTPRSSASTTHKNRVADYSGRQPLLRTSFSQAVHQPP